MNHMVFSLVLVYTGLMLKENELKRECVCVMCSLYQQIDDVYTVLHRLTFITVCEKDGKKEESMCEEEKVYVAVYVDGTSHSCVCPGFDTVQACCKTRANKGSASFEKGGSLRSCVSTLGEGFCL